jgi:NAD(P)-dependent dehydrogenase (short-subunit alcohol dehydrogenase family)
LTTDPERRATVTGGGGGIGRAIARRLARDGMTVGVLDRDGAAAQAVADEIGGLAAAADVTSEEPDLSAQRRHIRRPDLGEAKPDPAFLRC